MAHTQASVRKIGYRDHRGYEYAEVHLDCLVLDPQNPRIDAQESSLETLLALVKEDPDGLFNLAKDIVAMRGTNPGELPNVTPVGDSSFVVREANRRLAARKILKNPELLKGHLPDTEIRRWLKLAETEDAKRIPATALVVIGDNHEAWVDRRHLGPQSGVGLIPWNPEAKRRRDQRRRSGAKDFPLLVLDALKSHDSNRFQPLEPPRRTFTTFARVLESQDGRARLGIEIDSQGNMVLRHGERSFRLLEEVLRDLRREGKEKLTSRRIHSKDQITAYLDQVDARIGTSVPQTAVTLPAESAPSQGSRSQAQKNPRSGGQKLPDVLRTFHQPAERRLKKIFEELAKVRRADAPNAAMVLTRVLLELSIDHYATQHSLDFAGDSNPLLEAEMKAFWKQLGMKGIKPSKPIREALKLATGRPMGLSEKLERVTDHLIANGAIDQKEGNAKKRELRALDVTRLLNDAVHRLKVTPSIDRVNHILEVAQPIFNAMNPA